MNRAYSLLQIKSVDEEHRIIEGIASTPSTDRMGDIVEPKGAIFNLPLPLLWQHNAHEPIGHVISAKVTEKGIEIRARIAKGVLPRIDEAWALIKSGLVRGLSIGFKPIEHARIDGTSGLRFMKWAWYELSAVTIAANQDASISTIKSIDTKQRRAALGTDAAAARDDQTHSRARDPLSKGMTMRGINELQTRRDEVAGRMKELWDGCGGDRKTLEADDVREFDGLKSELGELDGSIEDQRAMERATKGAPVVHTSNINSQENGTRARQGLPAEAKKKEDPAMKGVPFAQYIRIMYHAKGMPFIAQQIARNSKFASGLDPRVPMLIKAAVEAGSVSGSSSAGNWGMDLVGAEAGAVADFAEFLRHQTIVGQFGRNGVPGLRRVPFRVPLLTQGTGASASWVGEGKAKPLTKFGFSRTTLEPLKIATIAAVTKELLADSSPAADMMLRDELAAAVVERSDIDFIDPTKTADAGVSPASITNGITPIVASGTGDAADVRADIRALLGAFRGAQNSPRSGVWIMNSNTSIAIGLMANALGQAEFPGVDMNGGRLLGMPIVVSDHVPGGTSGYYVVLVNAQDVYYADDGDVQVDTSEHASLEMDDAPSHDSVTPTETTLVSMFQTNSVAFRAERRLNWKRRRDSGVQVLSLANWGEA